MSNYTITTNFGAKDSLPSGNAGKVIKGSEFTTEFTNIQTAVATKANTVSPTFTGAVTFDAAVTVNSTATITGDLAVDTNTLFVDVSENKVGIGTTSPANTLTVGGLESSAIFADATVGIKCDTNHKGILLQENSGAEQWSIGVGDAGSLKFYDSDSATPAVTFADVTGNVGIGTTSPNTSLHVQDGDVRIESTFPRLYLTDTNNNSDYSIINNNGQFGVYDDTNATYRMVIANTSGNVGIGTTSPDTSLHVKDGDVRVEHTRPRIYLTDTNSNSDYSIINNNGDFSIYDDTNTAYRMYIKSSGNVGIGTSNPSRTLHVSTSQDYVAKFSSTDASMAILLEDSASTSDYNRIGVSGHDMHFTTNNAEALRIDSSGNVLVGTTSATAMGTTNTGVVLRDNDSSYFARNSNGTIIAFFSGLGGAGSISLTGNTANYNTTSDERLKENITDSADAGSKVDAIQIRQFDWKADGTHQDYGVIAQELVEVAPEAVHQPVDEEDMMGVDYSKLVPMLIKEVQSLRSRVAELENV